MSVDSSLDHLVGPNPEAHERIEAERIAQGNVGRVATARNESTTDRCKGPNSHDSEQSLQQLVPVKLQVSGNVTEDPR